MHILAAATSILVALSLCACGSSDEANPSEIVVTITSALAVPGELDGITIQTVGADIGRIGVDLTQFPLPQSLALVHTGGPLGPFYVEVYGLRGGQTVSRSSAETRFMAGRSVNLPITLSAGCQGPLCNGMAKTQREAPRIQPAERLPATFLRDNDAGAGFQLR